MNEPKNYITPRGFRRLKREQQTLRHVERPKIVEEVSVAAAMGDRSENAEYIYGKRRLRQIDGRLRWLDKRIEAAEIVEPATDRGERIFFGATVCLRYPDGQERKVNLVGKDEIEPGKGRISWRAPLGRALMRKEEGDVFSFTRPDGRIELEILEVEYLPQQPDPEDEDSK
jgi:transcription elongation factor GreB